MHILFLTDNFPPERNAPASRVYEHACYWVSWGHEVTVLTCAPNFPEGRIYEGYRNRWYQVEYLQGIRVIRVKTFIARNEGTVLRTLDYMSFMITGCLAGLVQKRPDVVVATSPQFFTAVGGWALTTLRRLPFVFELRDLWPASIVAVGAMQEGTILRLLERLERFLYQRSTKVIALTAAFKSDLISRGIPKEKIEVVINGVDLARFSPRVPDIALRERLGLDDCFVVGYIGTLGMAHALDRVLAAAELLRDTYAVRFLFVGAGAARAALVEEAARRKLENIVFVPAQPKEQIPDYWSICDLALVSLKATPLFTTVIPSKIFEAMGMGCPILLTAPEGEASRIVREADAGVVVPPECPSSLARVVQNLYHDKGTLERLAANARTTAPRYSREQQAKDMIKVLGEITAFQLTPDPFLKR
jgi:glycosyltransferase involved in cell wall biosynthesis